MCIPLIDDLRSRFESRRKEGEEIAKLPNRKDSSFLLFGLRRREGKRNPRQICLREKAADEIREKGRKLKEKSLRLVRNRREKKAFASCGWQHFVFRPHIYVKLRSCHEAGLADGLYCVPYFGHSLSIFGLRFYCKTNDRACVADARTK